MTAELERNLAELAAQGRLRRLVLRDGMWDFSSNDYLGLASENSHELRDAARAAIERGVRVGAGGSRLLGGNDSEHLALEAEAAEFFGSEAALYFASGFAANYTIFATLPQRGDLVAYDELIHASVHDGLRNGRAEQIAVRHNDPEAFDDTIRRWRERGGCGRPWLAVESLYSMDGDLAPLDVLASVARKHDGVLVIDEAHATGVLGADGRGLGAHLEGAADIVSLHTCGKALGASGALVCASRTVCDFIVNRGRAFIFSTAPSPLQAAIVRAAIGIVRDESTLRQLHADRVALAQEAIADATGAKTSGTHIVPVIIGGNERAVKVAERLQKHGFDVRAVRPPTVPEGTARLRISITMNAEMGAISQLANELKMALAG